MEIQPWNKSSELAKTLKLEDFGTPGEVREMAKMPRTAKSREEARAILKEIALAGRLTSKSGVVVSLSGKSIKKIVDDDKATHQSFELKAHWVAAANIDKLFSNAIEPWKFELNPQKNNKYLKDRRYFYAPMEYMGHIFPVKLTVKEFIQEEFDKRLYSIEAINVVLG